ncbi:MAG: hypothetical protein ABIF88_03300 [archaeon]
MREQDRKAIERLEPYDNNPFDRLTNLPVRKIALIKERETLGSSSPNCLYHVGFVVGRSSDTRIIYYSVDAYECDRGWFAVHGDSARESPVDTLDRYEEVIL